jgi:hypothetical protein
MGCTTLLVRQMPFAKGIHSQLADFRFVHDLDERMVLERCEWASKLHLSPYQDEKLNYRQ